MPQIGELNRGKSKHRPRNDPRLLGGPYPFIQTGDVKNSGGLVRNHSQTYTEFGLQQSRLWPEGTLCITIAANIADNRVILTYPACFPDSVVGFSADRSVTVRFAELFLRTAKQELARFAPATAQKNINLEILSEVGVPLPPVTEQERIVAEVDRRLSLLAEVDREVQADGLRADHLRQSILKHAFEGKLVPQDPNDEPVSLLLERIRADRASKSKKVRGVSERKTIGSYRPGGLMSAAPTTQTGYVNRNAQVTIRNTQEPGTDRFQYIYQLACSKCGFNYGANGSDIHERLCPRCQGGNSGLSYGD